MGSAHTGFTLIELIFVIVIIGVLSAVAIPRFANLTDNAKISSELATASSVQSALDAIHSEWITNTCDFDWGKNQNTGNSGQQLNDKGYPTVEQLGSDEAPFENLFKSKTAEWYRVGNKYYGPASKSGSTVKHKKEKPDKDDCWEYDDQNGTFTLQEPCS